METIFILIAVTVLGLIIGSFLNVCIHRLPREQSIVKPASHCPTCMTPLRPWHNIPLFSYLFLFGRCPFCRQGISPRYPLVEALSGLAALGCVLFYGLSWHGLAAFVFSALMICLAFIDLEHMILPDELTLGGALLFLAYSFFNPFLGPLEALLSGLAAAIFFLALYYFYLLVRKIEGLGMGDVKMMLLIGAFLGAEKTLFTVLLASLSGLAVGLFFILLRRRKLTMALPFGFFLGLAAVLALFLGELFFFWLLA